MRVLYLTDSLSDLDGVGRYTMRLIAALERAQPGLEVEILLARKHRPTSSQVPPHWRVRVALPPDYFFYMSPSRFWTSFVASTWRTFRRARRADLVHAIKDYPHSYVGVTAARLADVPCVATAHGTYTVQPLLDPRHSARARRAYGRYAAMISVSGYTRRRVLAELEPGILRPEDVHVIPNCVDAEHYLAPQELGERPWHGVPFTLGIGEVKERKGHHISLQAFCDLSDRHPDLHHFIVGRPSGDEYERSLLAIAEQAGCADRVHLLGNIQEDEKIDLLQRARLFVHTPVTAADGGFEGFGIVYLEASAAGTPVVGTLDCGAEDAILDGETGLLAAQTVGDVREAMARILGDTQLAARMGAAGRRHAAASSWDDNAAAVLEVYRKALA